MISKNQLVVCLLLLCIPAMHAYTFPHYLHRIGKKTLSLQHLCMYGTVYPYVLDCVHQNVQDTTLWQKGSVQISTYDISDLCVSILLELCYAALCGMRADQVQEHLVLTIYGALLHTCLQQIICVFRLHEYLSDETKQQYRLYGSSYVKALLACVCSEYVDPTKYQ